jgi:hypothetical protein
MAHCSVRRNWILGGYAAEYAHALTISSSQLSELIHGVLLALHTHLGCDKQFKLTRDFKGRDGLDALIKEIPGDPTNEVFRLGGLIATEKRGEDDFEWSQFNVACHATFREFEGTHHILHALDIRRDDSVPAWLPWRLLGAAAPIRPRYFRLGVERFQTRFTFASFGFLPQVTDSLLIDVFDQSLSCVVRTEQSTWSLGSPLAGVPLFAAIADALRISTNFDINQSLLEELKATGRFR